MSVLEMGTALMTARVSDGNTAGLAGAAACWAVVKAAVAVPLSLAFDDHGSFSQPTTPTRAARPRP